jgi:hypothetical protein
VQASWWHPCHAACVRRGPVRIGRRIAAVAICAALAGCATTHTAAGQVTATPSQEPAVTQVTSATSVGSPTPTHPPSVALGSLTMPLPPGISTVKVTFLRGTKSVYQESITDVAVVRRIIGEVDAIHEDTGQTQGCAMRPITMTLEFIAPSSDTVYSEDSGCARASLAFDGSQGPLLDAWLTDEIEALLHVTFDIDGSPSVTAS